jgi:hypothetical protein
MAVDGYHQLSAEEYFCMMIERHPGYVRKTEVMTHVHEAVWLFEKPIDELVILI